jgi:isopenicillin N synthase-like dioxygenase
VQANSIPKIDIGQLRHADTLAELDRACRDWGFFQITNHRIPDAVIAAVLEQAQAFFGQDLGCKREVLRTRENPWGFFDQELTKNIVDLKEVYDFGPSDGASIRPQWPAGLPAFRAAVQNHYWHCEQLAFRLLAAISVNLGMSPGYLSRGFGPGHTSYLRLNHYPVTPATNGGRLGVGPHTDAGALTLLLQDAQPGLEVFRDWVWHLVEPRHGAIVVNLGDIAQIWSNDEYRAGLHRVVASVEEPRYSIPFFLNPEYRTEYAPVPNMVTGDRPACYRPVNWGEFRRLRADGDYADYGEEVQIDHYRIPEQGDSHDGLH